MRNKFEQPASIEIKEVSVSSREAFENAASLVREHSWGSDYPIDPLDEIEKSEYCIGAYSGARLVGFATVNRFASPDGKDNGELWLGHAVVSPEFRQQGVYQKLYDARMEHVSSSSGRILACTSNPTIEGFFLTRGWNKLRDTRDEGGEACTVFEYGRAKPGGEDH